jgi:hypothetical protein
VQTEESPWVAVIGRALAHLALHKAELGNASIGEKAVFLEGLGVPRADTAAMLGASVQTVAVLVSRKKVSGRKRRAKAKKG